VGPEINEAQQLVKQSKVDQAYQVIELAVAMAPNYPYVNYVFAGMIFTGMLASLLTPSRKIPHDVMLARLEAAERSATIGTYDNEIPDAQVLLNMISNIVRQLRDAAVVGPLFDRHQEIVNQLNKGLLNLGNLSNYQNQLAKVKTDAVSARRSAGDQLAKVLANLINSIERDALTVDMMGVFIKFGAIMKELERKAPLRSRKDAETYRGKFRTVKTETDNLLKKIPSNTDNHDQLVKLQNNLDQILRQLG
jgi:hypothetical protein